MYANGRGVVKDDAVAMKWFRKAVERGHDGAQYYLGLISEEGWHDKELSSKNSDNSLGADSVLPSSTVATPPWQETIHRQSNDNNRPN